MHAMWIGLGCTAIMTAGLAVCGVPSQLAHATKQQELYESLPEQQRESLRGLHGVKVVIKDNLAPDIQRDGLREDQLRSDVELRLRRAGIRVLTSHERLSTPGAPYLYTTLTALKSQDTTYTVALQVELIQDVQLSRGLEMVLNAATWRRGVVARVNAGRVRQIRSVIADLVVQFINDYVEVNPYMDVNPK